MRYEKLEHGTGYGRKIIHWLRWDSVSEGVEWTVQRAKAGPGMDFDRPEMWSYPNWLGRKDMNCWDDVARLYREVWPAGMETMRKIEDELGRVALPEPTAVRRKQVWREQGDHYDLDRHRAGAECWRTTTRVKRPSRQVVTILANIGGNCNVGADRILAAGAAAVVVSGILEKAGYATEIVACWPTENATNCPAGRRHLNLATWEVKQAGKPVTVPMLVNACSPWFYRRVGFASPSWLEQKGHKVRSGLGYSRAMTADEVEIVQRSMPGRQLYPIQSDLGRDGHIKAARMILEAVKREAAAAA